MPLHSNYESNLADGKDYEDFVFDTLQHELYVVPCGYKSRHYQTVHGESMTGIEVKLDKKFRESGNLFVEIAETHHSSSPMKPSGIYHDSGPWMIVIGNKSAFWAFSTKHLRSEHKSGRFREVSTATSSGFLLPVAEAERICIFKWEP